MITIPLKKRKIIGIKHNYVLQQWEPLPPSHDKIRTHIDVERESERKKYQTRIDELESAYQVAREQGYKEGFEEGRESIREIAQELMERLPVDYANMSKSLMDQFDDQMNKFQEPLLGLAVNMAEKLIGKTLEVEDSYNDLLKKQIQDCLNSVRSQSKIIVQVNPEQIEWVMSSDIFSLMNSQVKENIRFVHDPELAPGECILETEDFNIDAKVMNQLNSMKNQILGAEKHD